MEKEFVKLHGLGNDFVFFDDMENQMNLKSEEVRRICDRHFGIGADGVIVVKPPKTSGAVGYMHYINSDGTLAQMCGNGVRCFAKYLVDYGYVNSADASFTVDTMAGPKQIAFEVNDEGKLVSATVDMGRPCLDPPNIPTALSANKTYGASPCACEAPISSPWGDFVFTCVSMGNPHAVCFVDDWDKIPDELFACTENKCLDTFNVSKIGAYYEAHPLFPEKTNVEFAVVEPDGIHMRVYERGCGETLACGTGACATGVAAALAGKSGKTNDLHLLGGTLHIEWRKDAHVFMTGPAEQSFAGTVNLKAGL